MTLFNVLIFAITMYIWLVILVTIFILFKPEASHPYLDAAKKIVEPPLKLIRTKIPYVVSGNIDFSPLVLIVGLHFVRVLMG